MKIIKPDVAELKQTDLFKHVELCGRTCYKSGDRITDDSCNRFINMLKEHSHGAMLEHGTVYLTIPTDDVVDWENCPLTKQGAWKELLKYSMTPFAMHTKSTYKNHNYYMTTNYRVIVENNLEDFMEKYKSECTEYHPKRRTFKITCNRGVSHEFVRHRVFSFAQESQRYVAYDKEKFGKELKFIEPTQFNIGSENYNLWWASCCGVEQTYMTLRNNGVTPQEARGVLNNDVATELIMTGFESDWQHFFELRCAKDAHPQAQQVANMIKEIYFSL